MSLRKILKSAGVLFAAVVVAGLTTAQAMADDWNPNNIIDEGLFLSTGSMSQTDIQTFLNGQGGFLASWKDTVDMYSQFTYHNNPSDPNSATTVITCKVHTHSNMTAAQIIYQASTNWNPEYFANKPMQTWTDSNGIGHKEYTGCGTDTTDAQPSPVVTTVSPKVLLTTLQKEQSLITATGSYSQNSSDYTNATYPSNEYALSWAMGYGVPDSGGKNGVYRGFYMQVMYAAWQLRLDTQCADGDTSQWPGFEGYSLCGGKYTVGQTRNIDGTNVTPQNGATDALYNYTPHFSGNQHFVTLYEQWFSPVHAPVYSWKIAGQYAYTDQTKTIGASTIGLIPGQRVYVGFQAVNTGNTTWTNGGTNPIKAGTSSPFDRSSAFCDGSWFGCNRPAFMKEASVAPGQTGTFEFWMTAPSSPGTYDEHFDVLAEGAAWMNDNGLNFHMTVVPPVYSWQPAGQFAYQDQSMTAGAATTNMSPGQRVFVGFQARNTGNVTWYNSGAHPIKAGTTQGTDRSSAFCDSDTWMGCNRPAIMKEASVAPGQIGTFQFWMIAPRGGASAEHFSLVAEGVSWMNDPGLNFYSTVTPATYSWQVTGQYAYTDQNKTTGASTVGLKPRQKVYVGFTAKNTGNVTWYNSGSFPVGVGTTNPQDRNSIFFTPGNWVGANRPGRMIESSVPPGGVGTFEFWMTAPSQAGSWREYFSLLTENYTWMNNPGLNFYSTVTP